MPRSTVPHVSKGRRPPRVGARRSRAWRFPSAPPRGAGIVLAGLFFAGVGYYGLTLGRPYNADLAALGTPGDMVANLMGFQIDTVSIKGQQVLTDAEIIAAAGITDTSSLLFFDAEAARNGLEAVPLIAHATVQKLFPNTVAVAVEEREPFALWQKDARIHLIAADGKVIDEARDNRFDKLPFVVGEGADRRAHEIIEALEAVPAVKARVRAASLVAGHRWNLTLDNDVVVRLPETGIASALAELDQLQAEGRVLDKAILAIDLRQPDRVAFRLTEEAAAARAEQLAEEAKKRKKGAAT